jgi:hypothetical protein
MILFDMVLIEVLLLDEQKPVKMIWRGNSSVIYTEKFKDRQNKIKVN